MQTQLKPQTRLRTRLTLLPALLVLGVTSCGQVGQPTAGETRQLAALATTQVIDLGTLPGGTKSAARAINTLGQIVGTSNDSTSTLERQVVWKNSVATAISAPFQVVNGFGSIPFKQAINDAGEVASSITSASATGYLLSSGYYWNPSLVSTALPGLVAGDDQIYANDINASGWVVGSSKTSTGTDTRAVIWNKTTVLRDLGFMGTGNVLMGNQTSATGLNDAGDVVGRALIGTDYRGFLWRSGVFTDLGSGQAVDINNSGVVVGNTNPEVYAAWIWQSGVRSALPSLPNQPGNTVVNDLNNLGDAVGSVDSGSFSKPKAVLWRGGQVYELGHYPGGDSSVALSINDLGQIVGMGSVVPGGPMHALVWKGWEVNTAPTVTLAATSATAIRAGGKVNFRATITDPDNGPWTYTINYGNGTVSGTRTIAGPFSTSRTYRTRGTYQVSMTATDARGSAGQSQVITVTVR